METIKTDIEGVVIVCPKVFPDKRGYFTETYKKSVFDKEVEKCVFVQDNQSSSTFGVVRGLHFQKPPHAQAKLVRCVRGAVLDVAVDIRKGSPTYGRHVAVELSEENGRQLFITKGFAHGFSVLSGDAVIAYKCDDFYAPECEGGIDAADPKLGIDWKVPIDDSLRSDKDMAYPSFADFESPFMADTACEAGTRQVTEMVNVLVTGADGQLGRSIRKLHETGKTGFNYIFTDVSSLDITDRDAVFSFVREKGIRVIVNCAAYTDVDKAEDNKAAAELLNGTAVGNLADAASRCGALLVHISTDYVFPGTDTLPYRETDAPAPVSVYGATKLAGEQAVEASGCHYLIFRTAWLYSEYGRNFLKTMLSLTASKEEVRVVFDQVGTPTYAGDLAAAIVDIVEHKYPLHILDGGGVEFPGAVPDGIYNFTDEGVCSWFDFAVAIARESGNMACRVLPCHSGEFASKTRRPAYSVLDKSLIKTTFGVEIPYWLDSLKKCMDNMEDMCPQDKI